METSCKTFNHFYCNCPLTSISKQTWVAKENSGRVSVPPNDANIPQAFGQPIVRDRD